MYGWLQNYYLLFITIWCLFIGLFDGRYESDIYLLIRVIKRTIQ